MTKPTVSVLMPAFNAGSYLPFAINCVLSQTLGNFELVIVDDGSSDGSVEAARERYTDIRIIWLKQSNLGKPAALNAALARATGEFVALMDADDECHPKRLERLIGEFKSHPELACVMSGYDLIMNKRHVAPISESKDERVCRRNIDAFQIPSHDPTMIVKTTVARDVLFDIELPIVEGVDFLLRLGESHNIRVIPEILYSYRVHTGSVTRREIGRRMEGRIRVIRLACVRRGLDPNQICPEIDISKVGFGHAERDNGILNTFINSVKSLKRLRKTRRAILEGIRCASLHPLDWRYHKPLFYSISPLALQKALKGLSLALTFEKHQCGSASRSSR